VLHQRLLPKQTKRLLASLSQHQPKDYELSDEDYNCESDVDLHRNHNRLRIVEVDSNLDDDQVSDYVAMRLAKARELAMQAYYTKYGKTA
jgi:hypothetical protein